MRKQLKEQGKSSISKVYDFIVEFITTNGYSPSLREISEGTGIKSTASISEYLFMLEQLGKINFQECKSRTISLVGYAVKKTEE